MRRLRLDQRNTISVVAFLWMFAACSKTVGGQATGDGDGDGMGGDNTGDGDGDNAPGDGDGDGDNAPGDGDGDPAASGGDGGDGDGGDGDGGDGDGDGDTANGDGGTGGVAELSVDVTDLGNGVVRLSYDFSDESHVNDWIASEPTSPNDFYINDGALFVDSGEVNGSGLRAVEFIRRLSVTRLEFDARLEEGENVNAYINFENDGYWAPDVGIGVIRHDEGVGVTQTRGLSDPLTMTPDPVMDSAPIGTWVHYVIEQEGTDLTVTVDGSSATMTVAPDLSTERALALGSYQSVVSFDNIVIEGELAQ